MEFALQPKLQVRHFSNMCQKVWFFLWEEEQKANILLISEHTARFPICALIDAWQWVREWKWFVAHLESHTVDVCLVTSACEIKISGQAIFRRDQSIKQCSWTTYGKLNYLSKTQNTSPPLCVNLLDFLKTAWINITHVVNAINNKVLAQNRWSVIISQNMLSVCMLVDLIKFAIGMQFFFFFCLVLCST